MKRFVNLAALSAVLAAVLFQSSMMAAAKTVICHVDVDEGGTTAQVIEVADPSLPAHFAHGDYIITDGTPVGDSCPVVQE